MAFGQIKKVEIKGIVCALPDNCIRTEEHIKQFDWETLTRVKEQTGVEQTYRVKGKQTISDLCCSAADRLIEKLQWERKSIGAIVLTTHAFDYGRPSTTSILQKRLSLPMSCMTLDINLGCSGFIYGMAVLGSLMENMDIERAILMCGDMSSRAVRPNNTTNLLFGDVGAAIALEKDSVANSMHFLLNSDGSRYKTIFMEGNGYRHPESENAYVEMEGIDVFAFSTIEIPKSIEEFMDKTRYQNEDFDLIALHQANTSIVQRIIKKCKFDKEKVPIVISRYGNTNSSSIPLTIADTLWTKVKRTNLHILAVGFGIGLSWGVSDLYIRQEAVMEIIHVNSYYDDIMDK